jgi:hypothetical protein
MVTVMVFVPHVVMQSQLQSLHCMCCTMCGVTGAVIALHGCHSCSLCTMCVALCVVLRVPLLRHMGVVVAVFALRVVTWLQSQSLHHMW